MEENTTQEIRHLRKDVPQMLKQQIPNHQLQPQDKSISEQQPQDESISEHQPQDESVSEQPQGASASEQQPQGEASTSTRQEPVPSQFSDDDTLPDPWTMARKTLATKDPSSIPKKPKYSLRLKTHFI